MPKIRRHVAGGALALMTAFGVLTTAASAAQAAEVFAATDKPTSAALSAAETSAAAQSMTAATTICDTQIKPRALQFQTVYEWQFPACAVAVHLCADEAFTNGKLALVHIYADVFDCDTWSGTPRTCPGDLYR